MNESEGGRKTLPNQWIKWDFSYRNPAHESNKLFMIWPEFLDENGGVLPRSEKQVPREGLAKMWIVNEKMKDYHRGKIFVGMEANGMEGPRIVAKYVVTEIVALES